MNNNIDPSRYLAHHTHINSHRGWLEINLKELWSYRDLTWLFVRNDFTVKYKQTVLGPLWLILNPFITTLIYTIVFGNIANLSTDGIPKLLFYMSGNALWGFFSSCLNSTAHTFTGNAYLFGKVYFPRLTKPISVIITSAIHFCIQLLLFGCFWIYYIAVGQVSPNWGSLILLPVLLLVMGSMAMGCGIIISSMTTRYRDLSMLVTFGVNLWMYATPVVYPLSIAEEGWQKALLLLNPVTPVMELFRFMLLGQGRISKLGLCWSTGFAILVLFCGVILFNRIEKNFMDTV